MTKDKSMQKSRSNFTTLAAISLAPECIRIADMLYVVLAITYHVIPILFVG